MLLIIEKTSTSTTVATTSCHCRGSSGCRYCFGSCEGIWTGTYCSKCVNLFKQFSFSYCNLV